MNSIQLDSLRAYALTLTQGNEWIAALIVTSVRERMQQCNFTLPDHFEQSVNDMDWSDVITLLDRPHLDLI